MNEEKIQELLKQLFALTYRSSSGYNFEVISKDHQLNVELIIRKALLEIHDNKVGEMEAKIFAYEQMISKSTFAPMIETEKEEDIKVEAALECIKSMFENVHTGHRFIIDTIKGKNIISEEISDQNKRT